MSPPVTAALASTESILVDVVWRAGNITIEQISINIIPVTSGKWACDTVSFGGPNSDPVVRIHLTPTNAVHKLHNQFWKPVINLDKVSEEHFISTRRLGIRENTLDVGQRIGIWLSKERQEMIQHGRPGVKVGGSCERISKHCSRSQEIKANRMFLFTALVTRSH